MTFLRLAFGTGGARRRVTSRTFEQPIAARLMPNSRPLAARVRRPNDRPIDQSTPEKRRSYHQPKVKSYYFKVNWLHYLMSVVTRLTSSVLHCKASEFAIKASTTKVQEVMTAAGEEETTLGTMFGRLKEVSNILASSSDMGCSATFNTPAVWIPELLPSKT